jgi:cell division protein FtsB
VVVGANFWAVQGSVLHPVLVKPLLERALPWSLLLLATLSVPWMVWSPTGLSRLEALEQQRKGLTLEVRRLEREIEQLRAQADGIKSSPMSIERVARDELGLVRQTEIVIQFKKD